MLSGSIEEQPQPLEELLEELNENASNLQLEELLEELNERASKLKCDAYEECLKTAQSNTTTTQSNTTTYYPGNRLSGGLLKPRK